eukprot:3096217-Amphidinium_carterae.1
MVYTGNTERQGGAKQSRPPCEKQKLATQKDESKDQERNTEFCLKLSDARFCKGGGQREPSN